MNPELYQESIKMEEIEEKTPSFVNILNFLTKNSTFLILNSEEKSYSFEISQKHERRLMEVGQKYFDILFFKYITGSKAQLTIVPQKQGNKLTENQSIHQKNITLFAKSLSQAYLNQQVKPHLKFNSQSIDIYKLLIMRLGQSFRQSLPLLESYNALVCVWDQIISKDLYLSNKGDCLNFDKQLKNVCQEEMLKEITLRQNNLEKSRCFFRNKIKIEKEEVKKNEEEEQRTKNVIEKAQDILKNRTIKIFEQSECFQDKNELPEEGQLPPDEEESSPNHLHQSKSNSSYSSSSSSYSSSQSESGSQSSFSSSAQSQSSSRSERSHTKTHQNCFFKALMKKERQTDYSITKREVVRYLKENVTDYRSELNFFCQIMRIPFPKFRPISAGMEFYEEMSKKEKDYLRRKDYETPPCKRFMIEFQGVLEFRCKYLNNLDVKFVTQTGLARGHRAALMEGSKNILFSVYSQIPEMWRDFRKIKQQKAIIV